MEYESVESLVGEMVKTEKEYSYGASIRVEEYLGGVEVEEFCSGEFVVIRIPFMKGTGTAQKLLYRLESKSLRIEE